MKIGYARVSTREQTLDLQVDQLEAAGCDPDHIYADKVSGSSPGLEYPGLSQALTYVRRGDQLVIRRLNLLGAASRT